MISILADHNIEGHAILLAGTFYAQGWSELFQVRFTTFREAGLSPESSDRAVWQFVQENQMLLLTDNRNRKKKDSLEQTMREQSSPESLPVLTVGNADRLTEREYREKCAARLAEIIYDLEKLRGACRLFLH